MNKVFYHVVTEKPMKLNQEIVFDENHHNGVYERINKEKDYVNRIYFGEDIELTGDIKKALREFALEDVRLKCFPNMPSRLSSLYVSRTYEEAKFWYDLFISKGRITYQIVKVIVDGPIFTGDAWNCFEGTKDYKNNMELANRYWSNQKNLEKKEPIYETLVSGKIKVIEIVEVNNNV